MTSAARKRVMGCVPVQWGARLVAICLAVALTAYSNAAPAQNVTLVNGDFEQGFEGQAPAGWQLNGNGFTAITSVEAAHGGRLGVIVSATSADRRDASATLVQRVDAAAVRNHRVRLRASASLEGSPDAEGAFWIRVDSASGRQLYLTDTLERRIGPSGPSVYDIFAPVPADAATLSFGFTLYGVARAKLDDFEIVAIDDINAGNLPPARLTAQGRANLFAFARLWGYVRFFHPSDEATQANWDELSIAGVERVERARTAEELRNALLEIFLPVAPTLQIVPQGATPVSREESGQDIAWVHWGVFLGDRRNIYQSVRESASDGVPPFARLDLPRGLVAFVPLRLSRDAGGNTIPAATQPMLRSAKPAGFVATGDDRTSRIAAFIEAWNTFRHFYPYEHEARINWMASLRQGLDAAANDENSAAFDHTLKELVASLRDGHGRVFRAGPRSRLPFDWQWLEGQVVVTQVDSNVSDLHPGDAVLGVDGQPIARLVRRLERYVSAATNERRRLSALQELARRDPGDVVRLRIRGQDGQRTVEVRVPPSNGNASAAEREAVIELEVGLLYVDLTRLQGAELQSRLTDMRNARGLIFDVRGYPTSAWNAILPYLSSCPLAFPRNELPVFTQPDQAHVTFRTFDQFLRPSAPSIRADVAFLTDARAISQAETLMSIVQHYRLGEIVGGPTAGTNGNVNIFVGLANHQFFWTGMRVLLQDGSQLHGVGIRPTVTAAPTIEGLRAGRDEVLDAAIRLLNGPHRTGDADVPCRQEPPSTTHAP